MTEDIKSPVDWPEIITQWKMSGLDKKAFCAEHLKYLLEALPKRKIDEERKELLPSYCKAVFQKAKAA